MHQLPLDLGHRPALDREDFLVAPCNEDAVAWIDRWPAWPASGGLGGLVLWGPAACGKTHLAHVWRQSSGAVSLDAEQLTGNDAATLTGSAKNVVVENFLSETAPEPAAEACLFHIHNRLAHEGGSLLVTGTEAPARSALGLPDLRSRLNVFGVVAIKAPDDALISAVLIKLFQDRQIAVGQDVIAYLSVRMERSFAAAAALVEALDKAALANRRQVTRALARKVLEAGSG